MNRTIRENAGALGVELRGFEPLTPGMPYTDLVPHHGR